jgi:Thermolysin metallopeptidase, catalytic domain
LRDPKIAVVWPLGRVNRPSAASASCTERGEERLKGPVGHATRSSTTRSSAVCSRDKGLPRTPCRQSRSGKRATRSPGALNVNQQNIVNFSGDTYRFFFNTWARDSYNGAGAEMQSVNNDPSISCPNANWNGVTTNYCNGVTADDVVAHEWGHAYTQYTHGLIYQWQPGALNESYSDIWGEVVDSINGAGTDSPAPVRSVGACSSRTRPQPILIINSPEARECAAGGAAFGPPLTFAGLTDNVVQALDEVGTVPGDTSPTNGCTALTNAAAVYGNIAPVARTRIAASPGRPRKTNDCPEREARTTSAVPLSSVRRQVAPSESGNSDGGPATAATHQQATAAATPARTAVRFTGGVSQAIVRGSLASPPFVQPAVATCTSRRFETPSSSLSDSFRTRMKNWTLVPSSGKSAWGVRRTEAQPSLPVRTSAAEDVTSGVERTNTSASRTA